MSSWCIVNKVRDGRQNLEILMDNGVQVQKGISFMVFWGHTCSLLGLFTWSNPQLVRKKVSGLAMEKKKKLTYLWLESPSLMNNVASTGFGKTEIKWVTIKALSVFLFSLSKQVYSLSV